PYPKAKTYNNIAEYYSRTFLKKGFESNKLSKKQEIQRERNYEWYYDTLGLSEYQRNCIQCTKKKKKRKGKKPVSVVTIPGSPLRSEKVTVCKSDFKDYCRRKYRSLNITSAILDIKSKEFGTFPSNSTSESSFMSSAIKTEPPDSPSVLPLIKRETEEFLPTSSNSTETECPSSLFRTIKSESPHVIKAELPSTSCVMKTEPYDSSDDSFSDDILVLKMKSNVQKGCTLKNVYVSPVSFQIKQEPLELSSKGKHVHIDSKYLNVPHQITNDEKLSKISKPAHLNSSDDFSLNASSNMKFSSALNESAITLSSQVKDSSSASVNNQKKNGKKHKKCSDGELKLQGDDRTPKHKKKQRHDKNKDDNSNFLDCDQSRKSGSQSIPRQKKCAACKENSSVNDSKSNIKPIKKCKKSALKSQENVLDCKKLSAAVEVVSKSNNIAKIKTENSPVVNNCTCKFPCGLSHLCTCGHYANAKEALSKFKIPRKKSKVKK
ncbi:hypothetical protein AVEN_185589-1, partial [Araneus ventricosus]